MQCWFNRAASFLCRSINGGGGEESKGIKEVDVGDKNTKHGEKGKNNVSNQTVQGSLEGECKMRE
jgi:hypothetical protein